MHSVIYAGSFDILTFGHMNIVEKACLMFDKVKILVCSNPKKTYSFDVFERMDSIHKCLNCETDNLSIGQTDGLVIDYANDANIKYLVRGIRNTTDMIEEMQLADINKELGDVETVFIPCKNELRNVSSSLVRELLRHKKDVSKYVPDYVAKKLSWYRIGES